MATIPDYLLGKDTTLLTLTPCSKSGGTLTPGSAEAFTGVFENWGIDLDTEMDQPRPATSTRRHNVPVVDGYSFTLDVINLKAAEPDRLLALFIAGRYYKVDATRNGKTETFYAVMSGVSSGTQGQGHQRSSGKFECVDTGATDFYSRA